MMRVRERRPEQRIQAQVKAQKEAKRGRVKQGWKASRKGAKERTKRSGMRRRPCLSSLRNERQETQKKTLRPLALPFLEQLQVRLRDLLEHVLHLSKCAQTLLYFFLHLAGDRDLAHLAIAETNGENPNRSVAFAFALLAKAARSEEHTSELQSRPHLVCRL